MTRLRSFGATAKQARLRPFATTATHARLRCLLLVVTLGLLARPVAAQTEIVEYYGHDALGSIRIVFTASGVATARADFEPFGEGVTIAGMPAGPLPAQQFTGQERDTLERQDYFGARYYRPRHGRFSQVDPVWGNLFDPQQLNRYAYVGNSPLRYVDPDGRMRLDADCQQLDLTFAKCAAHKAPDSFFAGVFGWQQFLRQGPTFSGGGPGGRRPKGPTEGGDGTDDSKGNDGNGDGNSNTNTNASNTGNSSTANSGQNTGDDADGDEPPILTSCAAGVRVVGNLGEINIQSPKPGSVVWGVELYYPGIGALQTTETFRYAGKRTRDRNVQFMYFGPGLRGWEHGSQGSKRALQSGSELRIYSVATTPPVRAIGTAACIVP